MGLVYIKWTFPDFEKKFKARIPELMAVAAATIQTNRGMLFDRTGAYNGHPKWKDLVLRVGQPLSAGGALRQSIGPKNSGKEPVRANNGIVKIVGEMITIGTTVKYAKILNEGGTIVPIHAKALKIPIPAGARNLVGKKAKNLKKAIEETESTDTRRLAQLQMRLAKAQSLLSESKSNSTKRKREQYIYRLKNTLRLVRSKSEKKALRKKLSGAILSKSGFIFRKKVTIPARNFTDWNSQDGKELAATLKNKITSILNGR